MTFIPTDRLFNPGVDNRQAPLGKGLAPQAGLRAVFEDGKAPQVGQLEISVEEGMIQKLSRRVVAGAPVGGCKLLDATLSEDAATGLLVNQTYALIAANCILCSAQAAVQTIRLACSGAARTRARTGSLLVIVNVLWRRAALPLPCLCLCHPRYPVPRWRSIVNLKKRTCPDRWGRTVLSERW